MARFGFRLDGGAGGTQRNVQIHFDELAQALNDMGNAGAEVAAQVAPAVSDLLVSFVQDVFEHEGAVAGKPRWPDLAESTKAKRRGKTYIILQNTGLLAGSITAFAEGPNAEIFTNVPYAGYHTSKLPRKKIPLRDFTDIDMEAFQRETADILLSQLETSMMRNAS